MDVNKTLLTIAEGTIAHQSLHSGFMAVNAAEENEAITALVERIGNAEGKPEFGLDNESPEVAATACCLAAAMGE